jgi:hypothetical protein
MANIGEEILEFVGRKDESALFLYHPNATEM